MAKELKGPGFHFDVHTDLRADQKAEVLIEARGWRNSPDNASSSNMAATR